MSTARVTSNTAVQPLFTVPLHMKAIIDDISIDNQGTSGPITMQLQDTFTQDISTLNAAPAARTAFPFQTTVAQNASVSADKLTVGKIECLGAIGAICSAIDTGCAIVVTYHFE